MKVLRISLLMVLAITFVNLRSTAHTAGKACGCDHIGPTDCGTALDLGKGPINLTWHCMQSYQKPLIALHGHHFPCVRSAFIAYREAG